MSALLSSSINENMLVVSMLPFTGLGDVLISTGQVKCENIF